MSFHSGSAISGDEQGREAHRFQPLNSRAALETAANSGDRAASAILRFQPDFDTAPQGRSPANASHLVERASAEFHVGQATHAATRLMALLADETTAVAALRCFADACLNLGWYEEVLALANRCLATDDTDVHALCVAGQAALALGQRKDAKTYLAKCARIARKMPEFVEELRISQRLLLQMHFV